MNVDSVENSRLEIQRKLDSMKSQEKRTKLGQFATPTALAIEMLEYAKSVLQSNARVRFMDPAFGTGAFYSALLRVFESSEIDAAVGYEIDPDCGRLARTIWNGTSLQLGIADFTRLPMPQSMEEKFNLIICNPPYTRHHCLALEEKTRLMHLTKSLLEIDPSGLSGLHCYFLYLCHGWMREDGIAGWLVPSELMDANYGREVKNYLLDRVTLLRVHCFDPQDVQFKDTLVTSAIVWFRKSKPVSNYDVELSYGGTLLKPDSSLRVSTRQLRSLVKWGKLFVSEAQPSGDRVLRLSDLFEIKRGLATGADKFFIMTPEKAKTSSLPRNFLKPILPQPRFLQSEEIIADGKGDPMIDHQLLLLDCNLSEENVKERYPTLWNYLEEGINKGVNERYLCKHRSPWYSQENRAPSPILCNYVGRRSSTDGRVIRFILNNSRATASNAYLLLYPKPKLAKAIAQKSSLLKEIWAELNKVPPSTIVAEGRTYGGGLHKLEPRELGNSPINSLLAILQVT